MNYYNYYNCIIIILIASFRIKHWGLTKCNTQTRWNIREYAYIRDARITAIVVGIGIGVALKNIKQKNKTCAQSKHILQGNPPDDIITTCNISLSLPIPTMWNKAANHSTTRIRNPTEIIWFIRPYKYTLSRIRKIIRFNSTRIGGI